MIGNTIKTLRKHKKIKVSALADKVGITEKSLYKYENNERDLPSDLLMPIADALDVSVDYLLRGHSPDSPREFIFDFESYAERHCSENNLNIIDYLTHLWDGDFNSLIQLIATYAAQPVEMRKDVAEHCISMFINGIDECDPEVLSFINIDKCKLIVERMHNNG